jgi:hypothetical protein
MASMRIGDGGFGVVIGPQNPLQSYEAPGFGGFGGPWRHVDAVISWEDMWLGGLCLAITVAACFPFVCVEARHQTVARARAGVSGVPGGVGARRSRVRPAAVDRVSAVSHRPWAYRAGGAPPTLACWEGLSRGGAHRAMNAIIALHDPRLHRRSFLCRVPSQRSASAGLGPSTVVTFIHNPRGRSRD